MGSAVPSRVSLLISILRLNLVLTYGIPPEFRSGVHLRNRHTSSGQSGVYRVTQLRTDGVHCRTSGALAGHHGPINIRVSFPHPLLVWSGHVESTSGLKHKNRPWWSHSIKNVSSIAERVASDGLSRYSQWSATGNWQPFLGNCTRGSRLLLLLCDYSLRRWIAVSFRFLGWKGIKGIAKGAPNRFWKKGSRNFHFPQEYKVL